MMMIYGMFVFMRQTAPYQSLEQQTEFRHVKNDRVGKSAKWQYIGAGEDTITLTGTLYPEITGGDVSLAALRTMAYGGKAWPLIEGTGTIYGIFAITSIRENRTEFMQDGKAQKIEFTLTLKKQSEDIREGLGSLTTSDVLSMISL
ncbi:MULTISPECIES: phage tail protein [unclassified Pantoea]|uniref:phage tail protein n=1 Tax=unclassified Pantoea TaxID=2630326 RepID=UPI001C979718|nr:MULTISPECIES: phage tail protein [unclassified Pantoea]MBY4840972.1 phage tail protein [Pantoea sp. DY-5]MDR6348532.1 phage protein U [Pantoea sp. SORGH_AS_0659]